MSENFNQLPGEPEKPGQPLNEARFPQASQPGPDQQPGSAVPENNRQSQPMSESIIPEQPQSAQPQYPPSPEYYRQMPVMNTYGVSGAGSLPPVVPVPPTPGMPMFPPPVPGAPAFLPPGYGYGYGYAPIPQAQPLPLGQAIRELPRQYKKILFKPHVRSFAEEQGKADWGIIWIQLLFMMAIQALASIPFFVAYNQALANYTNMTGPAGEAAIFASPAIVVVEVVFEVIQIPLAFLMGVGIQYLVAKAFKGLGSFKQQAYNQLLFQMPLSLVSALMLLILAPIIGGILTPSLNAMASGTVASTSSPAIGGPFLLVVMLLDLISLAVGVYTVILNVFSIMAAHRMSGGKATASVLIPYGILFVIAFLAICALILVGTMALHSVIH